MKRSNKRSNVSLKLLASLALVYPAYGHAFDLDQAWQLALANDSQFQGARFANESEKESLSMAKSKFLPSVRVAGSVARNSTDQTNLNSGSDSTNFNYRAERVGLILNQPLFRMDVLYDYFKADAAAQAADSFYNDEKQILAGKLIGAYVEVMQANERLYHITQSTKFYKESLVSAEKTFKFGNGTKTDVEDARAMLDSAMADEIQARNSVLVAEEGLAKIIGKRVPANDIRLASLENIQFDLLEKKSLDNWLQIAREQNQTLKGFQYKVQSLEEESNSRRAEHLPTVDLYASRTYSRSDSDVTIGRQFDTSSVGLQVNIPIYSGGGIEASYRQAVANREEARYQMDGAIKKIELEVAKQYLDAQQNVTRVRSLVTAKSSAELALAANEKSIAAGTRNIADLLNAQQRLLQVKTKLSDAKYAYVVAFVKLRSAAGMMYTEDMKQVSQWLR